ncbi:hypothetical protein BDQ94DRAFT_148724 [Aspergillus welwitschiae]|uniref:Uncharacterized protein n=1 Tax=Aspergillus welwitschiae TaxID=1341132 RepID=A0A3F3PUZ8_9EURO|nr:hypothetical protein BDQ94DRAFT_148724 [Aspergillus welwitschiae]RDH30562.1 hypothetical protein BDQ94DRAFT_148724 [Aspergillus welwitschiae]
MTQAQSGLAMRAFSGLHASPYFWLLSQSDTATVMVPVDSAAHRQSWPCLSHAQLCHREVDDAILARWPGWPSNFHPG